MATEEDKRKKRVIAYRDDHEPGALQKNRVIDVINKNLSGEIGDNLYQMQEFNTNHAKKDAEGNYVSFNQYSDEEIDDYVNKTGRDIWSNGWKESGFDSQDDALLGYDNGITTLFSSDDRNRFGALKGGQQPVAPQTDAQPQQPKVEEKPTVNIPEVPEIGPAPSGAMMDDTAGVPQNVQPVQAQRPVQQPVQPAPAEKPVEQPKPKPEQPKVDVTNLPDIGPAPSGAMMDDTAMTRERMLYQRGYGMAQAARQQNAVQQVQATQPQGEFSESMHTGNGGGDGTPGAPQEIVNAARPDLSKILGENPLLNPQFKTPLDRLMEANPGFRVDQYNSMVGGEAMRDAMKAFEQTLTKFDPDGSGSAADGEGDSEEKGGFDALLDELNSRVTDSEGRLQNAAEYDKAQQKREKARLFVAGLGDVLASVANLVGTAYGAENQNQTYATPLVAEAMEKRRAERKKYMDSIYADVEKQRKALLDYQIANDPNSYANYLKAQSIANRSREIARLEGRDATYADVQGTKANQAQQRIDNTKADKERKGAQKDRELDIRQQEANTREWKAHHPTTRTSSSSVTTTKPPTYAEQKNNAKRNISEAYEEIARHFDFNSWEEAKAYIGSDTHKMNTITEIKGASADKVVEVYASIYAPNFHNKYFPKDEEPEEEKEGKKDVNFGDYGTGGGGWYSKYDNK